MARPLTLFPFIVILLLPILTDPVGGSIMLVPAYLSSMLGLPAGITLGLGTLTGAASAVTKLGLIGPMALGLLSKAGLAFGVLGTAAVARDAYRYMSSRSSDDHGNYRAFSDARFHPRSEGVYGHDRDYRFSSEFGHSGSAEYHHDPYESSYTHYRKRRSAEDSARSRHMPVDFVEDEAVFSMIYRSDTFHCAERLICELAAKPVVSLHTDELLMLRLVKSQPKSVKGKLISSKFPYEKALFNGKKGLSCNTLYPKCPFTGNQMMSFIRRISRDYLPNPRMNKMMALKGRTNMKRKMAAQSSGSSPQKDKSR